MHFLFFGPLFFTYTCLLTGAHISLKHPIWISGLLICAFGISFPVTYLMLPVADRADFALSLLREPLPWQMTVINITGMLTIWAGTVASAVKIVRYKKRLVTTLSNLEKTKLTYVTRFAIPGIVLTAATTVLYWCCRNTR
ncbi:hypothetical protein MKQ70_35765 [Chitinophaga sedimenti]|uniref:hypothetical protein n=1 Tax=Chitinophaga sedimenti TaxID=2033606 RepID=UPI002002FF4C|nr:hypothetical protein [Chitinophaga sedimenti]MCK7559995.1 hypothetical protein [Chitinophaga sedimenti]